MTKKPGDNIVIRLKRREREDFLKWVNAQSNLSDAIRFLIEQEISLNNLRDLSEHIPAVRNEDFFYRVNDFHYLGTGANTMEVTTSIDSSEAESAVTIPEKVRYVEMERKEKVAKVPIEPQQAMEQGQATDLELSSVLPERKLENINELAEADILKDKSDEKEVKVKKKRVIDQSIVDAWNS